MTRRVAVITTGRSDYGLLYPLLSRLRADERFELALVVTGAHLLEDDGVTMREIRADGFPVQAVVPLESGEDRLSTARAIAAATSGIADALDAVRPEVVVLLGDRFETLAAATAALVLGIPIAHLHGGEVTLGSLDDPFRHAITKMATLHFPATETYRRRIVQMGADPSVVINVGSLAVDNVKRTELLSEEAFAERFGVRCDSETLLVTFHPVTKGGDTTEEAEALFGALERLSRFRVLFTAPNADAGGRALEGLIASFVERDPERRALVSSLGRVGYLSAAKNAAAVVGNSSSGLIEVPALGVPSVDVGVRQTGRVRPPSVVHTDDDAEGIVAAVEKATSPEHRALAARADNPYGDGTAAEQIVACLADDDLLGMARNVPFFDLDFDVP